MEKIECNKNALPHIPENPKLSTLNPQPTAASSSCSAAAAVATLSPASAVTRPASTFGFGGFRAWGLGFGVTV